MGIENCAASIKKSMMFPQIIDDRILMLSTTSTSGYTRKTKSEIRDTHRYLYTRVYSSIIHNKQMEEAAQVCTDGGMDEDNGVDA